MDGGSSSEAASAPSLSTQSSNSLDALDAAISHSKTYDNETSQITLEDERGRLKVWAANLGALQPAASPKSLDHRLRDAPLMRKSVSTGLNRVLLSVQRVSAILDGSAPNRTASTGPGEPGDDAQATTELYELMLSVHSAITHLFGLSMLIRRQRPKGRLPVLDHFTPHESSPDISNVTDKFPKAKATMWLARRLGNEITRRRDIIRYRQQHRQSLADSSAKAKEGRSDTVTLATTFQEFVRPGDEPSKKEDVVSSRLSVFTSATSCFSAEDSGGSGRRIPDLSDMRLDDVQLQYGKPFECPYCRTIQVADNRAEWKRHVMTDLQPYICTFQDCTTATRLFPTRAEWFQHEFNVHRQQWVCNWCDGSQAAFNSAKGLEGHFASAHPGTVTEGQMPLILEACERTIKTFGPSSCPLCTDWKPPSTQSNATGFGRHLARHLQQLALEALPLSIDGLEVRETGDESEDEGSLSAESREEDSGGPMNAPRDHPLYHDVKPGPDGLYHCPWEGQTSCNHKPEKLKINYNKFVDSHLKPYRCKVVSCENVGFSSSASLRWHEGTAHGMYGHGDKPFLCSYEGCDRSMPGNGFPRQWNLRDHMRRVHNDNRISESPPDTGTGMEGQLPGTMPVPSSAPKIQIEGASESDDAESTQAEVGTDVTALERAKAELARLKREEGRLISEAVAAMSEADLRNRMENNYVTLEEARRISMEEAKRDFERAKAEAERRARDGLLAERESELKQVKDHVEMMERIEAEARAKYEAELKAAEERREHEERARERYEARLRAEANAVATAMAEAERKAREDLVNSSTERPGPSNSSSLKLSEIFGGAKDAVPDDPAQFGIQRTRPRSSSRPSSHYGQGSRPLTVKERFLEVKKVAAEARSEVSEEPILEIYDRMRDALEESRIGAPEDETAATSSGGDGSVLRFKDALGRKFAFPFHICRRWEDMHGLIVEAFYHVDMLAPQVREGQYDLYGPDDKIIPRHVWERVVEPGMTIEMKIWAA